MIKRLQKIGAFLFALLFVCAACFVPAAAEGETSGEAGSGVTWRFDSATGTLSIGGNGAMDDYFYGTSTAIAAPWFDYTFQIKQIQIENGVTRIGDYAFYLFYNLEQVNIPASVTEIGSSAFDGSGLYYDKSNWKNGLFILGDCVIGTDYLATEPSGNFKIPDGIHLIADNSILMKDFGTLTLPASLQHIGVGALSMSTVQKLAVDAQNPYFSAEGAILYNKDKTELVAYLENDRDPYLTQKAPFVYEIPAQVKQIAKGAFLYCTNFTGVSLPAGIQTIGKGAFQGCEGLKSISFPEGLKSIGAWAFNGCSALQSVVLPGSLQTLGEKAFYQCNALESVRFQSKRTDIGAYCFAEDPVLKTVELPKKNDSVPDYIFQGCAAMQAFVIPDSVKTVGFGAFSYCSALESVTIPKSVEKINAGAFYDTALKNVAFLGSQAQWDSLKNNTGNSNNPLLEAQVTCLSGWKLFVSKWQDFFASIRDFFQNLFRTAK